ncbi:MAG: hypothetical protein RL708_1938 [Bacteroidota bacterium]|jgi:hypothetical protein
MVIKGQKISIFPSFLFVPGVLIRLKFEVNKSWVTLLLAAALHYIKADCVNNQLFYLHYNIQNIFHIS